MTLPEPDHPPASPSAVPTVRAAALPDPAHLLDRDLGLLEFQRRVFDEARDPENALLERVKFLSIVGSNLDEFAMTRVGGLAKAAGSSVHSIDGQTLSPTAHLLRVSAGIAGLMLEARRYLHDHLVPELARAGIHVLEYADLDAQERVDVDDRFEHEILPLLMPLGFDDTRPFPHVENRDVTLAVIVRDGGTRERFACVQLPAALPALVPMRWRRRTTAAESRLRVIEQGFVWVDQVVAANLGRLFAGMQVLEVHPFRLLRDNEFEVDAADAAQLPDAIRRGVRDRQFGDVVGLAIAEGMSPRMVDLLTTNLKLPPTSVHRMTRLLDLRRLFELSRLDRPDLRDPPFVPFVPPAFRSSPQDPFAVIREGDVLLHHPYESIQPVVDFLRHAATDPDVLAISTTLYRVGRESPVVQALLDARRAGKQVRVVVELRARFDEENNISWARALEEAGAHVTYGMAGLKVHGKLSLVVRREGSKLRRYVHVSSGNYNTVNATTYTDLALLTCDPDIASDATDLFNFLSGYAAPESFRKLIVAPATIRRRFRELVEAEIAARRSGDTARIVLKMNALTDPEMIALLYRASQAGVGVELIVRGVCCLRPGGPGLSDNITVRSIVGRFLEHSRVWYFRAGGSEKVFIGSADLMPRNLDRRVEVMAPIQDPALVRRLVDEILGAYVRDNVKARDLGSDGSYTRAARAADDPAFSSQDALLHSGHAITLP